MNDKTGRRFGRWPWLGEHEHLEKARGRTKYNGEVAASNCTLPEGGFAAEAAGNTEPGGAAPRERRRRRSK